MGKYSKKHSVFDYRMSKDVEKLTDCFCRHLLEELPFKTANYPFSVFIINY